MVTNRQSKRPTARNSELWKQFAFASQRENNKNENKNKLLKTFHEATIKIQMESDRYT